MLPYIRPKLAHAKDFHFRKLSQAAEQVEIAVKMETNDIVPISLLAAIELKQSSQTNYLSAADAHFRTANELLEKMPDGEEKLKRWREVVLNIAILLALESDSEHAKSLLQQVLTYFPDDATAKDVLKAIH